MFQVFRIIFAAYMIILAVMDIKWRKLSLAVLLSGFIFVSAGSGVGIIFLIISRVTEEAFGYGDSLLILIMGGFMGFWNILSALVMAFSMAAVFSVFMLVRKKFRRKSSFPFVPFLTAAYIGGMFFGLY